jgi:hypothetical protein
MLSLFDWNPSAVELPVPATLVAVKPNVILANRFDQKGGAVLLP